MAAVTSGLRTTRPPCRLTAAPAPARPWGLGCGSRFRRRRLRGLSLPPPGRGSRLRGARCRRSGAVAVTPRLPGIPPVRHQHTAGRSGTTETKVPESDDLSHQPRPGHAPRPIRPAETTCGGPPWPRWPAARGLKSRLLRTERLDLLLLGFGQLALRLTL